jgi:DNA-binding beta-propeller fold protein YncE
MEEEAFRVIWTAEYSDDHFSQKVFWEGMKDLIFGKNPVSIHTPVAALVDHQNELWVLNQGSGSILHRGPKKVRQSRLKNQAPFPSLVSLCEDDDGSIYIADSYLNQLYILSEANRYEPVLFPVNETLMQPTGIAFCRQTKELWVVETAEHRISVFNKKGELVNRIGARGNGPGQFNFPTHLWIDDEGLTYIVDAMNFRIQLFDSSGEYISHFGEQGHASGYLARPKGIATDSYGHIYIADALFNNVQVFTKEGVLLTYVGSEGNENGLFLMPQGIFIDEQDRIYISDSFNNRIQVFTLQKR